MITGLLPFNENEQRFEIQHTKGLAVSVPSPPALAKSNTAWVFCHRGWSAFPALPRLRQGDQRALNPGRAARCLLGSDPSDAAFHHTKLHAANSRAKRRHVLLGVSRARLVTEPPNWDGHRERFQAHSSPPCFSSSACSAARLPAQEISPLG